jgi:hypothetical protein
MIVFRFYPVLHLSEIEKKEIGISNAYQSVMLSG